MAVLILSMPFMTLAQHYTESVPERHVAESDAKRDSKRDTTDGPFIKYKSGYPNSNESGLPPIWLNTWIPDGDIMSAVISVSGKSPFFGSHYQKLKAHTSEIKDAFEFESIDLASVSGGIYQLRVQKHDVDLRQTDSWETEFRWLRETLEKLYWVLRVHDQGGWGNS